MRVSLALLFTTTLVYAADLRATLRSHLNLVASKEDTKVCDDLYAFEPIRARTLGYNLPDIITSDDAPDVITASGYRHEDPFRGDTLMTFERDPVQASGLSELGPAPWLASRGLGERAGKAASISTNGLVFATAVFPEGLILVYERNALDVPFDKKWTARLPATWYNWEMQTQLSGDGSTLMVYYYNFQEMGKDDPFVEIYKRQTDATWVMTQTIKLRDVFPEISYGPWELFDQMAIDGTGSRLCIAKPFGAGYVCFEFDGIKYVRGSSFIWGDESMTTLSMDDAGEWMVVGFSQSWLGIIQFNSSSSSPEDMTTLPDTTGDDGPMIAKISRDGSRVVVGHQNQVTVMNRQGSSWDDKCVVPLPTGSTNQIYSLSVDAKANTIMWGHGRSRDGVIGLIMDKAPQITPSPTAVLEDTPAPAGQPTQTRAPAGQPTQNVGNGGEQQHAEIGHTLLTLCAVAMMLML